VAKPQLPKLKLWVRFPSSAPGKSLAISTIAGFFIAYKKERFTPVLPWFCPYKWAPERAVGQVVLHDLVS
jgi:hypothetical protein